MAVGMGNPAIVIIMIMADLPMAQDMTDKAGKGVLIIYARKGSPHQNLKKITEVMYPKNAKAPMPMPATKVGNTVPSLALLDHLAAVVMPNEPPVTGAIHPALDPIQVQEAFAAVNDTLHD